MAEKRNCCRRITDKRCCGYSLFCLIIILVMNGKKKGEVCDMFQIFQEEKAVAVCMFVFLAISIFLRILLGILYQNMIREADNMATTRNKLLKQCKLKFSNCFQMNNGVANIPIFVDKFLNRLAIGPFSFETMYHLSGQLMLLSIVSSGAGVFRSIVGGRMLGEILPFYIVSFLGLYLYFSVSTVVDIKGKRRVLKVNLVDYLENHLSARIDVTDQDMEMLFGEIGRGTNVRGLEHKDRGRRRTVELMPIGIRPALADGMQMESEPEMRTEQEPAFSKLREKELEELLQEFLTL